MTLIGGAVPKIPQASRSREGAIAADKATIEDRLHFEPYVETLADIVADPDTETPLTMGIFGAWGSGKTSLMHMIRKALIRRSRAMGVFPMVWFDAWKYDREEALWRALVLRVLGEVRSIVEKNSLNNKKKEEWYRSFDDLEASLYRVVERDELGEVRIEPEKMIKGAGKMLLHLGLRMVPAIGQHLPKLIEKGDEELASGDVEMLFDAIKREKQKIYRDHIQHLEQFQQTFASLIREHLPQGHRLIVFIDDLDRCFPEQAIEVLEAIKLFFDVEGCVFVLGLDHQVIHRAIEMKYRERYGSSVDGEVQKRFVIQGIRYLEKIIQLPFHIPPIEKERMGAYVKSLLSDWPDEACADVFSHGMEASPRQIKRTVNSFLLLWKLAGYSNPDEVKSVRLAKVVAIQQTAQPLYEILRKTPRLLGELEAFYRQKKEMDERVTSHQNSYESSENESLPLSPALEPYRDHQVLRQLLTLHPEQPTYNFEMLKADEIRIYFTLTKRTASGGQMVFHTVPVPRKVFEVKTVLVPAGIFNMGSTNEQVETIVEGMERSWLEREVEQHKVTLGTYEIGQYPVTNIQYEYFVKDSGHILPEYWKEGTYPEDKGDHPVVEVSWEDARAYCAWLSEKTGRRYDLPTEAQWEKAARGENGNIYPWGNAWDKNRLNSLEGGLGDIAQVGSYSPAGDSPYGCADMAGNVWEWCLDGFDPDAYKGRKDVVADPYVPFENKSTRALRGGAFYGNHQSCRCAFRYFDYRYKYNFSVGFRIVLLP